MSMGGEIVEEMYEGQIRIFLRKLEEIKAREIRNRSLHSFGVVQEILDAFKEHFKIES